MGNQPSSGEISSGAHRSGRGFMRPTGMLGLTKAELDERCRPSGLYQSCAWEDKAIRKLIGDGKIAARLKGEEQRTLPTMRECPICFLHYTEVNVTKCCSAHICTECFLQVRPQREKSSHCPFCNNSRLLVTVADAMAAEDLLKREEAEQKRIEAEIRRQQTAKKEEAEASQFGASLEQNELVATMKKKTSSLSNENEVSSEAMMDSFSLTPDERRKLEDQMRAQHNHPLALQVQAEAEERRVQNEREYYRTHSVENMELRRPRSTRRYRVSRGGGVAHDGRRRDWNHIVDAFERGGNGEINSLDDLVVLEAAMILSMEEEARRRGVESSPSPRPENSRIGEGGSSADAGEGQQETAFDPARHASEGFPLVRSIMSGRQLSAAGGDNENQPSVRHLYARRRPRSALLRTRGGEGSGPLNTAMDTATFLMRGISEEDQVAMAIAASLQDQPTAVDGTASAANNENNENSNESLADENENAGASSAAMPITDRAASEDASSTASDYESTAEEVTPSMENEEDQAMQEVAASNGLNDSPNHTEGQRVVSEET